MAAHPPGARRAHRPYTTVLFLLALLGACAAPGPAPLDLERVAAEVTNRGATPETVAAALELAELGALPIERPVLAPELDYDGADFWHASALAYQGGLRAARRRFTEAAALAPSGGAPESAVFELEHFGLGDDADRSTKLSLTFDLLGLLDAGRAAASRELARAEARAALAEVERAAWVALIEVDRARTELGASLAKRAALTELLTSAGPSLERAQLLFERGRLPAASLARLRTMVAEVAHALHEQEIHVAWHRRALADAAGLAPGAKALEALTPRTLEDLSSTAVLRGRLGARELLEHCPLLRGARLEYAVAEAELRDEVARTRPGLRLGPGIEFTPDDALPGGILVLDLPHARALSGRVAAARERREGAREALEELLRSTLTQLEQARVEYRTARFALAEHAGPRAADSEQVWTAARARFAVDAMAVEELGMALRDRAMALVDLHDVRHEVVLAWLDHEDMTGPPHHTPEHSEPARADADRDPEVEP